MVRVEIQRVKQRFNSVLLLRNQVVLIGIPEGLDMALVRKDIVRFRIPWAKEFDVLMAVSEGHLNLSNGTHAFLCQTPSGRALTARRKFDRFYTHQFNNLLLHLSAPQGVFSIVDLSSTGCRIVGKPALIQAVFGPKRASMGGMISIGRYMRVHLESVTPKTVGHDWVGLEFVLEGNAKHQMHLKTILGTLATIEVNPVASIQM